MWANATRLKKNLIVVLLFISDTDTAAASEPLNGRYCDTSASNYDKVTDNYSPNYCHALHDIINDEVISIRSGTRVAVK